MFVCKNCGEKFDTQVNFCNQCGSSAIEPEEIPVYTAEPVYTYSAPVAPASSSPAGKILGIISMSCGASTGPGLCAVYFIGNPVSDDHSIEQNALSEALKELKNTR